MEAAMEMERQADWGSEVRTVLAALGISLRRQVRTRFFWACAGLAALPVGIALLIAFNKHSGGPAEEIHGLYENLLRILYLHFIVFFSANIFGFAAIRQDVEDQTLHYLLLSPARRWALMAGRYVAYLIAISALCIASLWLIYLIMMASAGGPAAVVKDLVADGRLVILAKESFVMSLGLASYGAIAMLMGCFFKSGLYAIMLLAWESGLPYLPSTLKYFTVMHYLQSLLPVRLTSQTKLFEMLGDPAPVWMCLVVLIHAPMVLWAIATAVFYWKEALYGGET